MDLLEAKIRWPEEEYELKEREELVAAIVARLPQHQREVLLLAHFHRFTYKEVAEILQVPVGTVKSRLHAAVMAFAWGWKQRHGETEED